MEIGSEKANAHSASPPALSPACFDAFLAGTKEAEQARHGAGIRAKRKDHSVSVAVTAIAHS